MRRIGLLIGVGLALVSGLIGCRSTAEPPTPSPAVPTISHTPAAAPTPTFSEPLAALVNGVPIFLNDYLAQVTQAEQALIGQGMDANTAEGQETLAQTHRRVLEAMIEQEIILQTAAREGVVVSDETVDATMQQSISEAGGQEVFQTWLQANDMSADDYRQSLHAQLVAQTMFQQVTQDVPAEAEQVHARHIALATEEEANQVLQRLQSGEDFAALARQFSQDVTPPARKHIRALAFRATGRGRNYTLCKC